MGRGGGVAVRVDGAHSSKALEGYNVCLKISIPCTVHCRSEAAKAPKCIVSMPTPFIVHFCFVLCFLSVPPRPAWVQHQDTISAYFVCRD